jgi:hypothetical protein
MSDNLEDTGSIASDDKDEAIDSADGDKARSTISFVPDANASSNTGESSNRVVTQNVFKGYYAGHVKIDCITPHLLQWTDQTKVQVSSQLGQMFPNLNITDELYNAFVETIGHMKKDFKGYVGNEFEKETTTYAQMIGMKNPQAGKGILSWSEFGNEFIQTPGYIQAA